MKLFKTAQIKEIDEYTIKNEPVHSIDLMERAAKACADWILKNIPSQRTIKFFAGPGNNGGDAWAVARILANYSYRNISFYLLKISDKLSPDSQINKKRLLEQGIVRVEEIQDINNFPLINTGDIIIDGIFGSGLTRPVEGIASALIKHINKANAVVISIDIPSGLFGEDNTINNYENIIKATHTLTFQFPKLSFFFAENNDFVGDWHILPIGLSSEAINNMPSKYFFITHEEIAGKIKKRKKFSHKGIYGNALLIAGSHGMMGAAVMAAKSCLRTGAGLVTCHVPGKGINIIQTAFPESIVSIDPSDEYFSVVPDITKYNAIGVGPGINKSPETKNALQKLLEISKNPLVIDADGINIIGENKELLKKIPESSILTPHPKEFERIAGTTKNSYERFLLQTEIAQQYKLYIVLKGAYTSVAFPDGSCYFNSTGNPGMATAGSGDVLTGMIVSLMAQDFHPGDAAVTGVFLHGMAADLAVKKTGEYSLISSDIIDFIGKAFLNLEIK